MVSSSNLYLGSGSGKSYYVEVMDKITLLPQSFKLPRHEETKVPGKWQLIAIGVTCEGLALQYNCLLHGIKTSQSVCLHQ